MLSSERGERRRVFGVAWMARISEGAYVFIFEVTRPGTWLEGIEDENEKADTEAVLRLLISCLQDAAVSLSLFEDALAEPFDRDDFDMARWQKEGAERQQIVQRMTKELPAGMSDQETFQAHARLGELADIEMKRQRWRDGEVPRSYKFRLPFIHAKSCLYALDTLLKALKLLKRMPEAPAEVGRACSEFESAFPGLVHVRDSAHHAEDRVQGKRRNSRIKLQPVPKEVVNQPLLGVLVYDMLADNRFGCTLGAGTYGEVEISATSVARAHTIVQSVYDAFKWSGSSIHEPSW